MSDSLQPHGLYSPRNSSGQNIGVGSLSLPQRIFSSQESDQGLLHCRQILYQLSYLSPYSLVLDYIGLLFVFQIDHAFIPQRHVALPFFLLKHFVVVCFKVLIF